MKWTLDQEKSIYAPPAQIVVSAAAGSGKTQVLTTRITERIKDTVSPVSVEKLLVVTFTKAAASEMRERIGKSLREALKTENDTIMRNYLKRQLSLLGSAHISTIDSFCYDVVKQNFFKVNLPSDISIGENGELSLLKFSALEETVDTLYCALEKCKGNLLNEENEELALNFESYFPDEDERKLILYGFEQLTNTCAYDKKDSEFTDSSSTFGGDYTTMILQLYNKAQSVAYPEKWLTDISKLYKEDFIAYEETPAFLYAYNAARNIIQNAITSLENAFEISTANEIGYEITFSEDVSALSELLSAKDYTDLYKMYKNIVLFSSAKPKKRGCDAQIAKELLDLRNSIKKYLKDTLSPLLNFSLEESRELCSLMYPQIKALCSATILLDKIYFRKMTDRRIIDFSACEHLALEIISEDGETLSETGEALKNRFDEIYIDEFQDSNNLQNILFSLISKGRTFIVGDVKQSIYGFRNADPTIFKNKCQEASFDENAKKRKIFLSKNFRSSQIVVNAVNSIFDTVMTQEATGINYIAEHRLDFGADFMPESVNGEKCEISIIEKSGNAQTQAFNEASYISNKINELVKSKRLVYDKDLQTQRPICYSDIAVLMRSPKSVSDIYENVFKRNSVPYFFDGGNDLYETAEVGQIIEILKLIDNSKNDISLACALRSPMFMFDENDLLKVKLAGHDSFHETFYGICDGRIKVEPALAQKCKSFMKVFTEWRKNSGFLNVEELIRRIYRDTNIYSSILSLPDGQLRRANLDLLLEEAAEFERSSYSGLFNFVTYVQKMRNTSEGVSEAKPVSEKMNVVRIMTIHKSKGLEFPVVFLANASKPYKKTTSGAGGLIINDYAGIGIDYVNPVLRYKYKSPVQNSLLLMAERDASAEEMRLCYVALTRAREKLYVIATLSDYDSFESLGNPSLDKPTANEIFLCNSYISLISLAYFHGGDKYWKINIIEPTDENDDIQVERHPLPFTEDRDVNMKLDYIYPYKEYVKLPGKASVTYLKTLDIDLSQASDGNISELNVPSCKKLSFNKPDFKKETDKGTFFGNAHHKFLQYFDFKNPSVKDQLENMLLSGTLTPEEADVIRIEAIVDFLESNLGKLMRNAVLLHREESFVINVGADEINSALSNEEKICVQGIIDCYFEKDESTVVLVDYKTDAYNTPDEIKERYKKQLYYYEMALKQKFKNKFIQKYLYLIHKNDIIEV